MTDHAPAVGPLGRGHADAARALVLRAFERTPYAGSALEALTRSVASPSAEVRALAAVRDGELAGIVVYGIVAGTVGAGRVYLVAVGAGARRRRVGARLLDAAVAELERERARFVLAEVPDDARLAPGRELLARAGFAEESRVPDYYADGAALTFLRRPLSP